jgi:hypothetical protein
MVELPLSDSKREPSFPRLRQIGTRRPPKQGLPWKARFLSKVDRYGPLHAVLGSRCHLWLGGTKSNGYGQFKHEGKMQLVHRLAFLLAHGRWPVPHALHHCDSPLCVNPDHLYEGHVRKDSSELHHRVAKIPPKEMVLSEEQVEALRRKFNGRNLKLLAKQYGISNSYATELIYTTTRLARQETSAGVRA